MAEAVFAAAATLGAEAVGFAFAAEGVAWSWATVGAKMAYSSGSYVASESQSAPLRTDSP